MVTPEASVIVRAPHREPLHSIERFLREKSGWIQKTIAWVRSRPRASRREFADGETFLYFGRPYPLTLVAEAGKPLTFDNGFFLRAGDRHRALEIFESWYRAEAKRRIPVRVEELAERFGLKVRSVKINGAKRRWGSCGPYGDLNFTWRLMMTPPETVDYVIFHELVHLRHKNHSFRFWNCVASLCPDYRTHRRWLRENSGLVKLA